MFNASLIDGPVPIAIYGEPYTTDEGNEARDVIGYVDGYHLNVAPQVYTEALEPYRATPRNPRRVFAGAETVFLRFEDEAEARAMLGAYWTEEVEH
jgi:hypothetical protein